MVLDAPDGPAALVLMREQRPFAVLLDVSMPEMGGLAVLRAAHELYPAMAVVMLTGDIDLEVAREALECGARSYVTKPFDPAILREEIKRLLEPCDGVEPKTGRPWKIAGE